MYGSRNYDYKIDIWSLGCTLAELILHQPLFPGQTDINQLELIFKIIGYPVFWFIYISNSTGPELISFLTIWNSIKNNNKQDCQICYLTLNRNCLTWLKVVFNLILKKDYMPTNCVITNILKILNRNQLNWKKLLFICIKEKSKA